MSFRAKSMRAMFLSLVLAAAAASGFVASSMARGSSREAHRSAPAVIAQANADAPQQAGRSFEAPRSAPAEWLGHSGQLLAMIDTPATLEEELSADSIDSGAVREPGLHDVGLVTPDGKPFHVVSLIPYTEKSGTKLDGYYVGNWPADTRGPRYAPPAGFIQVTSENERTPVSRSFRLADFLTHDQQSVWPKYLVLKPKLVDKLELIEAALAERGLPSKLHVMSGFRTPQYNALEVHPGGRAALSRHMYGDASDVFVDADGNGVMDDLNGDGKIDIEDARVLLRVAESVEAAHPDLVGGLSAYPSNGVHGPFVHVDTRGVKARW